MTIVAFAPGVVQLLGDPIDELGLGVLAQAIDRGVRVRLEPAPGSATFEVELADVGRRDVIAIDGSTAPASGDVDDPFNAMRAAVTELLAAGAKFPGGARLGVRGDDVPGAGCGSSSARVVAFLRALVEFAGASATRLAEPRRLAELAWRAEVGLARRHGVRAVPFVSAIGGLCHVNFGPTPFIQELPQRLDGLVLIESGERPALPNEPEGIAIEAERAFAPLRAIDPALDVAAVSYESIWNLMLDAGRDEARERIVFATLLQRDLLLAGLRFLAETPFDRARFGELLDERHAQQRALHGAPIARPIARIEQLRVAAREAGALGAALNGPRGSGDLFAWAPGREESVAESVRRLGARAQMVNSGAGARLIAPDRA